ncbi:MAG: DNA primase large subunit PriL [Candidatus Bathyarchaeia archaeon]
MTTGRFTKSDLAKYPFLKETTEYIKKLNVKIEDLANPELERVLERAEERVEDAILYTLVGRKTRNEEIEILSFPAAIMLTVATGNSFIKKRYALAEAKRIYEDLKEENRDQILEIATDLGWKLALSQPNVSPLEFAVSFQDYLRSTTYLRDKKWKLINRVLSNGTVFLSRNETSRLLSEEVRRHIEERLEVKELPEFPKKITNVAERIMKLSAEKIGKAEIEEFPKVMVQTAFPPCIAALYLAFSSGRHISHVGRFALTSFLINIGMPSENVIDLFKNISDFNEKMTRYQVEHIAGETGSRTRYIPPRCDTLQTHGICTDPDELCRRVRHPLAYYRIRLKSVEKSQ